MDELAKPWIVVRNGQIIGAYDQRTCAYAVARDIGAQVYWCDGVRDCLAHLALMAEHEPQIAAMCLTDDTPAEAIHDMIANALGED